MSESPIAFLMQLKPGCEAEYERRHRQIWPELAQALREAGIHDYSIFLDETTLNLFAVLRRGSDHDRDRLTALPIMRKWWDYMADLMLVQADNRPVERPLRQVFRLD